MLANLNGGESLRLLTGSTKHDRHSGIALAN